MADRLSDFVTEARTAARKIWEGVYTLKRLQAEHAGGDYGNQLPVEGEGENAGVTRTEIGAVVFDTANAIEAVFAAGHATNIVKVL